MTNVYHEFDQSYDSGKEILDRVTDHVLAYRPKPKSKAAKKRARKKRKKKRD
jgi:hypothetical protein